MTHPQKKFEQIVVVGEMPVTPLVVISGDVMLRAANLAVHAEMDVNNAQSAEVASRALHDTLDLQKAIEAERVRLKNPFLAFGKKIDDAARGPMSELTSVITTLRHKLAAWQAEEERRAREAEKLRQAELRRLQLEQERIERERLAQEEKARLAAEAARAVPVAADDDLAGVDEVAADNDAAEARARSDAEARRIAEQAAALAQTRTLVAPKPAGISYRTTLRHQVLDVRLLPSNLVVVTPNDAAIRACYCTGWKEGQPVPVVAGLTFKIDKQAVDTRRGI